LDNKLSQLEIKSLPFGQYFLGGILLSVALILGSLAVQKFLPPVVPLFYGLAEGEEQLAPKIFLSLPAVVSLLILLINGLISLKIQDEFLKKALVLAAIGSSFFAAITIVKIALLVGSF